MTTQQINARNILREHARKLAAHVDDPDADLDTMIAQTEQSAALARAEVTESTSVATQAAEVSS